MRSSMRVDSLTIPLLLLLSTAVPTLAACPPSTEPLKIEHLTSETNCAHPSQPGDKISVHYRGTLQSDGSQFDASYDRGSPFSFKVGSGQVIKGWDEGLLNMCVGDKRRLIIGPEKGYGEYPAGTIPPCSTLIFETELMSIPGISEELTKPLPAEGSAISSAIASASTTINPDPTSTSTPTPEDEGSEKGPNDNSSGECRLLGPFALIVQALLGLLALLSLVFKRWRESPRRPLKVFLFDASKQVVGTALLHVVNLAMSMFSSSPTGMDVTSQASEVAESAMNEYGRAPNPCSFYLLNLAIDTTIGIPVLVVCLQVLHALFLRTPMANPPESIKSGNYGQPPRVGWWIKQCFIYFLGLFSMKLFVFFLFQALPWLAWVGDWALRWTEGNESLQIAFVMFLFPLAMNAIQYYIIDAFIKDQGDGNRQGYQTVGSDDRSEEDEERDTGSSEGEESSQNNVKDENKTVRTSARLAGGDGEASSSSGVSSPADPDVKDDEARR